LRCDDESARLNDPNPRREACRCVSKFHKALAFRLPECIIYFAFERTLGRWIFLIEIKHMLSRDQASIDAFRPVEAADSTLSEIRRLGGTTLWRGPLGALLFYSFLSVLFFGRGLIGHFTVKHIGESADPALMMWHLVWWPYAIRLGINPFYTRALWVPSGFNLTWTTSIPLLSLVAAPLTSLLGPIAALNLLCLAALPIAAMCAFVLCRYVSGNDGAALLGGYIFGFSPFMLGQLLFAHLHTIWIFPLPLILYFTLRHINGEIGRSYFAIALAALLTVEFLCSLEIFATITLFGAAAFAMTWLLNEATVRRRLSSLLIPVAIGYAVALVVVSPYLYFFLIAAHPVGGGFWNARMISADLLNLLIPSSANVIGSIPALASISAPFNTGLPGESIGYISLPLLAIAAIYLSHRGNQPTFRMIINLLLILIICSLGASVNLHGKPLAIPLPWIMFRFSLLKNIEPVRFSIFIYLIFALITSLWIASVTKPYLKLIVVIAIIASLLPNFSARSWIQPSSQPPFFRDGIYRQYLQKNETVLILPFWPSNDSMLWQAETSMYFRMAQGAGPWPLEFQIWPIVDAFSRATYLPDAHEELETFLVAHGIRTIIVEDRCFAQWSELFSSLGVAPTRVGGVALYKLEPQKIPPSFSAQVEDMTTRLYVGRFETLLSGIRRYLANGGDQARLRGANTSDLGLIPRDDIFGPSFPEDPTFEYGMGLFVNGRHLVVIAEYLSKRAAQPVMDKYQSIAEHIDFKPLDGGDGSQLGLLVAQFDPVKLATTHSYNQSQSIKIKSPS
jgi:hypothetical protein